MNEAKRAVLALADGTTFVGKAFGALGEAVGEVVFNTSLTGYQEILTDPSYAGQIICMTAPEIGNVGVNPEDVESRRPFLSGFVVREYWDQPSNFRATQSLGAYLEEAGVVGISGIDTRALVRHIRNSGAQMGIVSSADLDEERLIRKAKDALPLVGRDLVAEVTCEAPYDWTEGSWIDAGRFATGRGDGPLVVAYDFGVKQNILRCLVDLGCRVRVVPATTSAAEIRALSPAGVFLSNGPGDPEPVTYAIEAVASLVGDVPIFGICLGHQILGLALGAKTYKLEFGHHGGNQPVFDIDTERVEITSQNHGFAVDVDSLAGLARLTHVNLNDRTVEGLELAEKNAFSVQYHPEASPGPHDARHLFRRFLERIEA